MPVAAGGQRLGETGSGQCDAEVRVQDEDEQITPAQGPGQGARTLPSPFGPRQGDEMVEQGNRRLDQVIPGRHKPQPYSYESR